MRASSRVSAQGLGHKLFALAAVWQRTGLGSQGTGDLFAETDSRNTPGSLTHRPGCRCKGSCRAEKGTMVADGSTSVLCRSRDRKPTAAPHTSAPKPQPAASPASSLRAPLAPRQPIAGARATHPHLPSSAMESLPPCDLRYFSRYRATALACASSRLWPHLGGHTLRCGVSKSSSERPHTARPTC